MATPRKSEAAAMEAKNLMMIQRIDLCAESILDKATHTALYKFNSEARAWEKTEVDGAMFIYKRSDHPFFSLMIANRQSPEDLIEPILPKIRVKMDKPYIFFCKEDGMIRGLWFYQESDCERVYNLLNKIITELLKEAKASPAAKAATVEQQQQSSTTSGNLLNMLLGSGSHAAAGAGKAAGSSLSPTAAAPHAATPKQHVRPVVKGATSQNQQQAATTSQYAVEVDAVPSMLQKLMAEQLPPSLITGAGGAAAIAAGSMTAADLERDLLRQSRVSELVLGMNPSISAASLAAISNLSVQGSDPGDIAELESMVGAFTVGGGGGGAVGAAGCPVAGSQLSPTPSTVARAGLPCLDKDQLVLGFMQLLQSDDEFVAKIHQAYVEALNRRLGI